ncbi:hypothetical protein LIA77_07333 [Sarocladium implicatum]|nr:hypothetical protein LIA77_07333 [Sarocladium implicatum]
MRPSGAAEAISRAAFQIRGEERGQRLDWGGHTVVGGVWQCACLVYLDVRVLGRLGWASC